MFFLRKIFALVSVCQILMNAFDNKFSAGRVPRVEGWGGVGNGVAGWGGVGGWKGGGIALALSRPTH